MLVGGSLSTKEGLSRYDSSALRFGPFIVNADFLKNSDPHKPAEDAFPAAFLSEDSFLVFGTADGVTRSKDPDGNYPDPSPARMVADAALAASIQYPLEELRRSSPSPEMLFESLRRGNEAVGKVNEQLGLVGDRIDYGVNDLAATALTMGILEGRENGATLYWGHIADNCLLLVGPGQIRRVTSIQTAQKDMIKKHLQDTLGNDFDNEVWRRHYRSQVRNHKGATYMVNGQERQIGYGALTGEREAEDFFETGVEEIPHGAHVLLMTDGSVCLGYGRIGEIVRSYQPNLALGQIFREANQFQLRNNCRPDDMSGVSIIDDSSPRIFHIPYSLS